jgi:hypothetical protein
MSMHINILGSPLAAFATPDWAALACVVIALVIWGIFRKRRNPGAK